MTPVTVLYNGKVYMAYMAIEDLQELTHRPLLFDARAQQPDGFKMTELNRDRAHMNRPANTPFQAPEIVPASEKADTE